MGIGIATRSGVARRRRARRSTTRRRIATTGTVAVAALVLSSCMLTGTWTTYSMPSGTRALDVECATPTYCATLATVGGESVMTVWDGTGWTSTPFPFGLDEGWDAGPRILGCWAPQTCMAAGIEEQENLAAYLWDGSTWTRERHPYFDEYFEFGDCSPDGYCIMGSPDPHQLFEYRDGTWTGSDAGEVVETFYGRMGCGTDRFCAAPTITYDWETDVEAFGVTIIDDGAPTFHDLGYIVDVVDCSSPTFCLASGSRRFARWDGAAWTQVTVDETPSPDTAIDIDCAAEARCLATTGSALYAYWGGDTMAKVPARPDPTHSVNGIGCAWNGKVCLAIATTTTITAAYRW